MTAIFKKQISSQELLRKNQAAVNKVLRELEREKIKMQQQENKIIAEIKKMAKEGQMESVRILAKDLVRTRNYEKKFNVMKANFRAISMKLLTFRSYSSMMEAMNNIVTSLRMLNKHFQLPQIQKILQEFEIQNDISSLKESTINERLDDVFMDDDDDIETEDVVNKVLDELGLEITDQLSKLPESKNLTNVQPTSDSDEDFDASDLLERLKKLRKE